MMLGGMLRTMLRTMLGWCIGRPHIEFSVMRAVSARDAAIIATRHNHSHGRLADTRWRYEKNTDEAGPHQGQTRRYIRTDDSRHDTPNLPSIDISTRAGWPPLADAGYPSYIRPV